MFAHSACLNTHETPPAKQATSHSMFKVQMCCSKQRARRLELFSIQMEKHGETPCGLKKIKGTVSPAPATSCNSFHNGFTMVSQWFHNGPTCLSTATLTLGQRILKHIMQALEAWTMGMSHGCSLQSIKLSNIIKHLPSGYLT